MVEACEVSRMSASWRTKRMTIGASPGREEVVVVAWDPWRGWQKGRLESAAYEMRNGCLL